MRNFFLNTIFNVIFVGSFLMLPSSFAMRYTDLIIQDEPSKDPKYRSLLSLKEQAHFELHKNNLGLGYSKDGCFPATLIHERVAVTAAHCLGDQSKTSLIKQNTLTFYGQTVKILNVIWREGAGIDNKDIALIELAQPITAGRPVKIYKGDKKDLEDQWLLALSTGPICCQDKCITPGGGVLHLARSHYRSYHSNRMVLDVYGRSTNLAAKTQYPDNDPNNPLRGVGIGGDSGSPLFYKSGDEYQLVGIVSSVSHGSNEVPVNLDLCRAGYIDVSHEYNCFIKFNVFGI